MAIAETANLSSLLRLAVRNNLFDFQLKRFPVLGKREQRFTSREQSHFVLHGKSAVHDLDHVDSVMWDERTPLDAAHRFVTYSYLNIISFTSCNNSI